MRSHTGYAAPEASTSAGSTPVTSASASISRASATVSDTTSAGPLPRSTSTDSATSSALPTARPSGTDMSVSSAVVASPWSAPMRTIVSASSRARADRLHERPGPHLDVEHQPTGALRDLLAHDRARDQRDRLDGAGHVAQRVELAVGRGERGRRGADDRPDVGELGDDLGQRQRRAPAGDRLQLVQRAAGVSEPAAGQLGHRRSAGRHERRQRQRDLVTDAAGGVLVDERSPHRGEGEHVTGVDHGLGPAGRLGRLHAVEQDGHRQRRHLLVGHVAARVGVEHPVDLGVGQAPAVPLGRDHVHRAHRCHGRSAGPNASGRTSRSGRAPRGVSSRQSGPPSS